jgi:O-antigen/teichoic acid export membrane protein
MREELFRRDREPPPPLPLVGRDDEPAAPPLPPTNEGELSGQVAADVVAQPPRMARTLRPELVRVAVAVGLTLYLVRVLSPSHYGVFVLAGSIAGLVGYPVVEALGLGVALLLSERPSSPERVRRATAVALRAALPIAVVLGLATAGAAGVIAQAYGFPALGWPLRWAGLAIIAGCALRILQAAAGGLSRGRVAGGLVIGEAVLELVTTVALVLAGAGVSGAAAARPLSYAAVAALGAGLVLATGRRRRATDRAGQDRELSPRTVARSASRASTTGLVWAVVVPVQAILIGARIGAPAVGSFGAEVRLLTAIASISAAAALVYVRRAAAGVPDNAGEARRTLKWSIVASGLLVAPSVVWASPISAGLFGSGHPGSAATLRWLAVYAFVAAPIAVLSVIESSSRGGAGRWALVIHAAGCCALVGYLAIHKFGVAGAAITVDGMALVALAAQLQARSSEIVFDRREALLTALRTVLAAAAMAAVLLAAGTVHVSTVGWVAGSVGGVAAFTAVLLVTGEISLGGSGTVVVAGQLRRRQG